MEIEILQTIDRKDVFVPSIVATFLFYGAVQLTVYPSASCFLGVARGVVVIGDRLIYVHVRKYNEAEIRNGIIDEMNQYGK